MKLPIEPVLDEEQLLQEHYKKMFLRDREDDFRREVLRFLRGRAIILYELRIGGFWDCLRLDSPAE